MSLKLLSQDRGSTTGEAALEGLDKCGRLSRRWVLSGFAFDGTAQALDLSNFNVSTSLKVADPFSLSLMMSIGLLDESFGDLDEIGILIRLAIPRPLRGEAVTSAAMSFVVVLSLIHI